MWKGTETRLRSTLFDLLSADVSASSLATGMLKSIMKRKDGSNSNESRTTGKKSLQFVGILNGGWVHETRVHVLAPVKIKSKCDLHKLPTSKTIVSVRYESTSSEEEEEEDGEDEEEEDGSSSVESGEGECLDSTDEDEAALEETSEEERNVNLDESDTDEETLRASNYSSDAVKEKYVFF